MILPIYRGRKWPERLVSTAKGMLAHGFSAKIVAKLLGVPVGTVQDWQRGTKQASVEADLSVLERVAECVRRCE